jgi:hypothetical protein
MPVNGLSLLQLTPQQQRARLRRKRTIEQALRRDYDTASSEFERVISTHQPGRVQQAYDRYVRAAVRLENFLRTGDIPHDIPQSERFVSRVEPIDRGRSNAAKLKRYA